MGGVCTSNHDQGLDRRDAWVGSKILTETITERASVGMALLLERNGALLRVHAEVWTKVLGSCGKKVLDNAAIVRDATFRTPPWLLSGSGCRGRRLSRALRNSDTQLSLWRFYRTLR